MNAGIVHIYRIALALVFSGVLHAAPDRAPIIGIVQGDNVNVRARADANSEVVTQASFGEEVIIKGLDGDWLEIAPPDDAKLWVHVDYLNENQVKAKTLHVRAGASLNYSVVGVLERGDPVVRLSEKDLWVQIQASEKTSLFISKDYVNIQLPPKPEPVAQAPQPKPVPVKPVVQQPPPRVIPKVVGPVKAIAPVAEAPMAIPLPKDLDLVPLAGQGRPSQRQGIVHAYLLKGRAPSRYYLSIETLSGQEKVCYLKDDSGGVRALNGQRIFCTGRDYWVQGQTLPVMIVESFRPVAAAGVGN
ncbi:MAG: hypothetical protein ACI9TH_000367 [Kiritimatiellia bacterium]|jgi:uncharacterized protein YraI